jgi:hypothetical protein
MRFIICLAASLSLCASATAVDAKTAFQLNKTTWTFVEKGKKMRESIDAGGNYITNTIAGKHVDHGTARMKGSKACFTSAMDKEGEVCWTTRPVKIGQSMVATSDKGRKLKVTRVAYVPLKM